MWFVWSSHRNQNGHIELCILKSFCWKPFWWRNRHVYFGSLGVRHIVWSVTYVTVPRVPTVIICTAQDTLLVKTETLKLLYEKTIQPVMDCAWFVWCHTKKSNINKLQRVQNYAARINTGSFDYINTHSIGTLRKSTRKALLFHCSPDVYGYSWTNTHVYDWQYCNG